MNKIRKYLNKIVPAKDKLAHMYFGLLLVPIFYFLLNAVGVTGYYIQLLLVATGFAIGYFVEVFQKKTDTGVFEHKDALYTALPFVIFSVAQLISR